MKNALISLLFFLGVTTSSTCYSMDIQAIMQDTQKIAQTNDSFIMVWWVPVEYWQEVFKDAPGMSKSQRDEFIEILSEYTTFAIIDAKTGPIGGVHAKSRNDIAKNIRLSINNKTIKPLKSEELSPDASNFFAGMKPVISNMLGQFGQGLEFFVYPNQEKGKQLVDPKKAGNIQFSINNEVFTWRLPLGCFMPPKYDKKTGEKFPGNYIYNPFTGKKLTKKP